MFVGIEITIKQPLQTTHTKNQQNVCRAVSAHFSYIVASVRNEDTIITEELMVILL